MKCPLCTEPLDDTRPWQPDFDGEGGVHLSCLAELEPAREDDDE